MLSSRSGRTLAAIALALGAVTVAGLVALWPGDGPKLAKGAAPKTVSSEVVSVRAVRCQAPGSKGCARVSFKLSEGKDSGRTTTIVTFGRSASPDFRLGDHVRLTPNPGGAGDAYTFSNFERRGSMLWLLALFAFLVVALARWRGLLSLIGLGVSLAIVLAFIVPAILDGSSPEAVAIIGSFAVMFCTILLAHGAGPKSLAAVLGTAASLLLTVGLAVAFADLAHLTGFGSEESNLLTVGATNVSLEGIIIAGMVIGALGVLDDVTITQASTVLALRRANPGLSIRRLYSEALSVGRDHVAATVNTLVLAYAGSSLTVLLLLSVDGAAFFDSINNEAIAVQVVSTLVGSIGLIAAVPITTALAAVLARSMSESELARIGEHAHAH